MQDEGGFRIFAERNLMEQSGGINVDYHTGPLRKGFSITSAASAGCTPSSSCSCG